MEERLKSVCAHIGSILAILAGLGGPAHAQSDGSQPVPSKCMAIAQSLPKAQFASYQPAQAEAGEVVITYAGHSTYIIETPGGVRVATDYSGAYGADPLPRVVTMNKAHRTHFSPSPDPAIEYVLRGWNQDGDGPARHAVVVDDIYIRNVPTDIRRFDGMEKDGNSIFVFEVAGLCIGHLGHLHHEPTPEQFAALGRLDVVMAAVDGSNTLDLPSMIAVLKRLKSSIVIPMHWFGGPTLDVFLAGMADEFAIVRGKESDLTVSLRTLPSRPTVHVLFPRYLRDPTD